MTREIVNKIFNKLAEAEQPLPQSLEFYRRLLAIQAKVKPSMPAHLLSLTETEVSQHLRQGKPLLIWDNLALDWGEVLVLFEEVTSLIVEKLSPDSEEIEEPNQVATDQVSLEAMAKTWFEVGIPLSESPARDKEIKPLIAGTIYATLQPFLSAYSEKLLPRINQELWHRRYCPVCGGEADFAFLDKERGARWLLCSRCDAEWLFYRLGCPYCGNQNHHSLAYFSDDKGLYRLYVCEQCRRYLKSIDLRKTESEILLPLERILTLDMDRQAGEMGYKVGRNFAL